VTVSLALRGVTIIDGTGQPPIEDGVVLIAGDRISALGRADEVQVPAGVPVIEGAGKTVLPGLADMHAHFCGGWDGESTDFLSYQRHLNSYLYSGITTFFDVGNVLPYIAQLRQEIYAGRIQGPRILMVGPLIDGPDASWGPISQIITSIAQIPSVVAGLAASGVDALKAYSQLSFMHVAAVAREGEKYGLPVVLDAWRLIGGLDMMKYTGIKAWAHLDGGGPMEDTEVQFMVDNGLFQFTTLTVYESFALRRLRDTSFLEQPLIADTVPDYTIKALRQHAAEAVANPGEKNLTSASRLEEAMKNALTLHEAGVPLVAGTDAPYPGVFFGEGLHRELELLVEAGLSPVAAIACATGNAARMLRAEREWGTIAPGLVADLVLVDGRPDQDISLSRNVETVIQAGKVLDREALKYDPDREIAFRDVSVGMTQEANPLRDLSKDKGSAGGSLEQEGKGGNTS